MRQECKTVTLLCKNGHNDLVNQKNWNLSAILNFENRSYVTCEMTLLKIVQIASYMDKLKFMEQF